MGRTGTDAAAELADAKTVDDVDRVFRRYLKAGWIPDYIAKTGWWPGKVTITGGGHTLEILVAPDYGAVGTNADPLRIGKSSQFFAQEYADAYDSILPSQKIEDAIEATASPKIGFIAVQKGGGADDSVQAVITANDKADAALSSAGVTVGSKLTIGYRKAYVTRPGLNGDYLAIYGGRWSSAGGRVQPPSGHAHTTGQIAGTPNYSDYSHGLVLVSRTATLDGDKVDLRDDVFGSKDPSIYGLVSSEGRFDPVFPNAGGGSLAKFAIGSFSSAGSAVASKVSDAAKAVSKAPTFIKVALVAVGVAGGLWLVT